MLYRKMRRGDIEKISAIHDREKCRFDLPEKRDIVAARVIEIDGDVVGWIGAEETVVIYGVFDRTKLSPHMRMKAMQEIQAPMREELREKGYKDAYTPADPCFKKFCFRLAQLGWQAVTWPIMYMTTGREELRKAG